MPSRVRTIRWCGYELPLWAFEYEYDRRMREQEQRNAEAGVRVLPPDEAEEIKRAWDAGAEDRTRTGMPPQDFESRASTSSATPATEEANR